MDSVIRILDLVRWPVTVIVLSWSARSILAKVVARPTLPAAQSEAGTCTSQADGQDARFQAYSHLSRMHSSSSTTFFAAFVAYAAYLLTLARLHPIPAVPERVALVALPFLLLAYQAIKYFVTNMAFKRSGECITLAGGPNLHEHVFGQNGLYARGTFIGPLWLRVTQHSWGWVVLAAIAVMSIGYLIVPVFRASGQAG